MQFPSSIFPLVWSDGFMKVLSIFASRCNVVNTWRENEVSRDFMNWPYLVLLVQNWRENVITRLPVSAWKTNKVKICFFFFHSPPISCLMNMVTLEYQILDLLVTSQRRSLMPACKCCFITIIFIGLALLVSLVRGGVLYAGLGPGGLGLEWQLCEL